MPRASLDFGRISAATAKRLLDQYRPLVRAVVRLHPASARDDLLAVGDVAILEGFLKWQPEKASEGTWIRRIVHWRISGACEFSTVTEQFDEELFSDAHDTEREVLQGLALRAINGLSPRHQSIIQARLANETFVEISESLGLSKSTTHDEYLEALKLLRINMEQLGG